MTALLFRNFIALTAAVCLTSHADAVTLDWDANSWTPGSLSNGYNVDPLSAGNDVTISATGDTVRFFPKGGSAIPAVMNIIEGGHSPVQNALVLHLDLTTQTEGVTITVDFSALYAQGVRNVSFALFDVDFASGAFQDQIRSIRALSSDGVTWIAPTITAGAVNQVTGTGLNQIVSGVGNNTDTGPTSGGGNVTISFGANAIRRFSFIYGSGTNAPTDPTSQGIAMHDISFTPVPEVNPALTAVISCLAAIGLINRHRARFRK